MEGRPVATQVVGSRDECFYTVYFVDVWDIAKKVKAKARKGWFTVDTCVEASIIIGYVHV